MCAPVPTLAHFWLKELVTMTYVVTAVHYVLHTGPPASLLYRSVSTLDVTVCCLSSFMCLRLSYRWKHAAEKVMEIPSPGSARHSFTRPLRGGSLYDETPLIGTVTVHTSTVTVHTGAVTVHTGAVTVHTGTVTVHTSTVTVHTGTVTVHTGSPCCPSIGSFLNNYCLNIQVFRDVAPCRWASCLHRSEGSQCRHLQFPAFQTTHLGLLDPEDEGAMNLHYI